MCVQIDRYMERCCNKLHRPVNAEGANYLSALTRYPFISTFGSQFTKHVWVLFGLDK
ncbi:hypothetical protein Hanom_Chr08g00707371 [Helianthus anomalus]